MLTFIIFSNLFNLDNTVDTRSGLVPSRDACDWWLCGNLTGLESRTHVARVVAKSSLQNKKANINKLNVALIKISHTHNIRFPQILEVPMWQRRRKPAVVDRGESWDTAPLNPAQKCQIILTAELLKFITEGLAGRQSLWVRRAQKRKVTRISKRNWCLSMSNGRKEGFCIETA